MPTVYTHIVAAFGVMFSPQEFETATDARRAVHLKISYRPLYLNSMNWRSTESKSVPHRQSLKIYASRPGVVMLNVTGEAAFATARGTR